MYTSKLICSSVILSVKDDPQFHVDEEIQKELERAKQESIYLPSDLPTREYLIAAQIVRGSQKVCSDKVGGADYLISALYHFYETHVWRSDDTKFKAETGPVGLLFNLTGAREFFPKGHNPAQFGLWMSLDSNNDPRVKEDTITHRMDKIENLLRIQYGSVAEILYLSGTKSIEPKISL